MKILLLSPLPPPEGGIATFTGHFLTALSNTDCSVTVIDTAVNGRRKRHPEKRYLLEEIVRTVRILRDVRCKLKKEKQILHLCSSLASFGICRDILIALLAKRCRVPILLHCHCDVEHAAKGRLRRRLMKNLCRKVDMVICLQQRSRRYIKSLCGCPIKVIPNFLPDDVVQDFPQGEPRMQIQRVVYVGTVCKEKGCESIIKATKSCPAISFYLVGRVAGDFPLEDLPANIHLTGPLPVKDVYDYLKESDVFLFPSKSEGFPFAVLEAMAAGLPILATPVGAIPEMLGKDAVFLKPDGSDIIEKLAFIEPPSIRRQMGEKNKHRAKACYTASAVRPIWMDVYRTLWKQAGFDAAENKEEE